MSAINCSVHFLTLKQMGYDETNPAITFYHDRTHFDGNHRNIYAQFAEEYNLQQGRHFVLHNRLATLPNKISKLKDQVKEFDSLLDSNSTNELALNYFQSGLNTNLIKLIWLAANRILILTQDSTLVWLIIDPISGDLIKILIDKSLTDSCKLNGKILCDMAIIMRALKLSPLFIFAYSDKSKIDLITFKKSNQISEYLKSAKEVSLEKLSSFEPQLVASYEFACPQVYLIEKRIITQLNSSYLNESATQSNTFTLWWVNDGQANYQNAQGQTQIVSLLERDDLRNNIHVLSTILEDPNLLEYLFKSDGLLLYLGYLEDNNNSSLIAVEQTETNKQKYQISIYEYRLPADLDQSLKEKPKSPKIKLTSFEINSKLASIDQIKKSRKYILMLAIDQTMVMYDIKRNIVKKFNLNSLNTTTQELPKEVNQVNEFKYFNGIEWLMEDFLFCVYNLNGHLKLFDLAFNNIDLNYMTRYTIKFNSISSQLNENLFTPFETTNSFSSQNNKNRFVRLISSRNIFTDSLWSCFHYSKGPFGLFRLSLPNNFNPISLATHYIKNSQFLLEKDPNSSTPSKKPVDSDFEYSFVSKYLRKAVNLLISLNWDEESHLCLAIFYRILNFLLSNRVVFNLQTETLIDETFSSFYKPKRALSEKTILDFKYHVAKYARRYFYVLLRNLRVDKAYSLAVDIGSKDLFTDLYHCALDTRQNQIAEACRVKYHEIKDAENQQKIRVDLNRSITTVDDNIQANCYDLDGYSVSSSGNTDVESDCSFSSSEEYEWMTDELRSMNDDVRLSKENFEKNLEKNKVKTSLPRFYSEEEIEEFATQMFLDNKFIFEHL